MLALAPACSGDDTTTDPPVEDLCPELDATSADEGVRVQAALCRLGVDITAPLPPMQDKNGSPVPTPHENPSAAGLNVWHPLGKANTTYRPEREWFALVAENEQTRLAGGIYEANNKSSEWTTWASLRDGTLKEVGNLDDNDPTTAWVHHSVKTGTQADLDGDGYEEAAVAYLDRATGALKLVVTDDASESHAIVTKDLGAFGHFKPAGDASPGHLDITAGDVDGDGRDELVIAMGVRSYQSMPAYPQGNANAWNESVAGAAKIIVIDDKHAGYATLTEKSFGNSDARAIYVAAGNGLPDVHHAAEIAVSVSVAGQAKAYVFAYDEAKGGDKLTLLMDDSLNIAVNGRNAYLADVTFADLDRDRLGEFVFAGVEKPSPANPDTRYVALSLEAANDKFGVITSRAWTDLTSGDWAPSNGTGDCNAQSTCDFVKVLDVFAEALDIDGDSNQEVLINNWVYSQGFAEIADSDGQVMMAGMLNNDNTQARQDAGGDTINAPFTAFHRSNTWITVGDFDANGKDEIAYWGRNRGAGQAAPASGQNAIRIMGWDTTGNFRTLGFRSLPRNHPNNPDGNYPVLFALNADNDSARVSFVSSETNYTEPYPLAAIAAAPCYADPDAQQNLEECHAGYTTFSSRSDSFAEGGAFHLSIGGGAQFKFIGTEDELMAHFKYDYEGLTGTAREQGQSNTWEGGANQDVVVFTSIPVDIYRYKVTGVGTIPLVIDGKEMTVNEEILISVPRRASNFLANLDYYNNVVKDIAADRMIGEDVFRHTAGDPTSYPTPGDVDVIAQQRARTQSPFYRTSADKVVTVPQGGSNVVALTLGEEVAVTETFTHEIGGAISFAGVKGHVAYEVEVGAAYRRDIEYANTTGFELEASIGGIGDDDFYEKNRYGVGTFSYFKQVAGRDMRVVNFWREAR